MRPNPQIVDMLREEMERAGLLAPLADPETTDLMVNENGTVWLQHLARGQERLDDLTVSPDDLESLLGTVASLRGTVISRERPVLEATLPFHDARLEALLPPLVTSPVLALRKPPERLLTLDDLVDNETLPRWVADRIAAAFRDRETCLVAGGVGTGKTTLANALLQDLLDARPGERVVILEEGARELHADGNNLVRLLTSDSASVGMTALLRAALRLNPSRILVGEVRGAEALDFLRACSTGHPGSLLTLHATGATDALYRLDLLAQEAGVPSQLHRIIEAVELVAFVARADGRRRLVDLLRVVGRDDRGEPRVERLYST